MIARLDRKPQNKRGERHEKSTSSMPSKEDLVRALNDLSIAKETGEIPKREADLLIRYLVALFVAHHLRVTSDKHFGQIHNRFSAVFQEALSE